MGDIFTTSEIKKNFFVENVAPRNRGRAFSLRDMGYDKLNKVVVGDARVHDANFAFLQTTLAKLHTKLYEPKYWVTYADDIPVNPGGGFVDYVSYYTVDWAGIMDEFRNVFGNNANYIPRVNAGLNQRKVNVYTFEVAYDLRFIELEKMKKLTLQKSIQEIYNNAIVAGFDLFVQKVAYLGINGGHGLFNSPNVQVETIDNSEATEANKGFTGLPDIDVVSFFNGVFEKYLTEGNMNFGILPDRFLVPPSVGKDLSSRFSQLYTSTLRKFIIEHNLGVDEGAEHDIKIQILSRPDLEGAGTGGHGRIVAYKKDESFVRLDLPYPIQLYITLPNIDKMSYTSAFVGQVSEIQLPYNTNNTEFGCVTYWDFVK